MLRQYLTTSHPFDVYTDRDEAVAAILSLDPTYEVPEYIPYPTPADIANIRWEKEVGGILWNGYQVNTSRESVAALRGVSMEWKFINGWATLTSSQLQSLYTAVSEHVEACFARERELLEHGGGIYSGWPTTL